MSAVLAYSRFIFILVTVIFIGLGVLLTFGQERGVWAEEFDALLGEAMNRGTSVDAANSRKEAAEIGVRKAWSRFLPSVEAYGDYGSTRNNALGRLKQNRTSFNSSTYGVSATLPIFRGGANYYGLKEARASAEAETHTYQEARQVLLLDTARAILGIIRDRKIARLERENKNIVRSILNTTQRQYEGGEATKTDIAIARDQYTAVQSVYTQAINNLKSNETEFERLIGRRPGRLYLPKGLSRRLPKSLNVAISMAESQNPLLLAAVFRAQAADHALKGSYSKFLPSVDLNMDYSEERYPGETTADESDLSVKLNFKIPLFQPDVLPSTDISRRVSDQRRHEARDARLTASAMATIAWRSYHTAVKRYRLAKVRIEAAHEASHGMRRELRAGQRTVLDVLDTQERLVQAKVQAANVEYERYMAAHLLLSAIGRLNVSSNNHDQLGSYVNGAEKRWRQKRADFIEKRRAVVVDKRRQTARIQDRGQLKTGWATKLAALGEPYLFRISQLLPALPVLKPREEKRLDRGSIDRPKDRHIIKSPKTKENPALRNGIYSELPWLKKPLNDEEIITASIKKNNGRKASHYRYNRTPKVYGLNVSVPPVPELSPHTRAALFYKRYGPESVAQRAKLENVYQRLEPGNVYQALEPEIVEYPDTPGNRFALWWNGHVDTVFGAPKGPKAVLVPAE